MRRTAMEIAHCTAFFKRKKGFHGGNFRETADCLLSMGGDVLAKNRIGDQPLHCLAESKKSFISAAILHVIVSAAGNHKAPDVCGKHPLFKAIEGRPGIFVSLLSLYKESEYDKMTLLHAYDIICDQGKKMHKVTIKVFAALLCKDARFREQFKARALRNLLLSAKVCDPMVYGMAVNAVVKILQTDFKEVLS
eukprot:m.279063 g.279063  ORF g.279063 m.279063 type:complete len:193 (+) comp40619_c0_seq5:1752-2330(+)